MHNRTIILTGASSGIGRLAAVKLARRGAQVVLAARSESELAQVQAEIEGFGGVALAVRTDVSQAADVDHLVQQTLERFGRIDVLINNAGFGVFAPVEQADFAHIEQMMQVNYFGAVRCIQAVLPAMRKAGRGQIINVASVAGLVFAPNMGAYSATKHALVALSQALQVELGSSGITCSLICPGPIDTPFFEQADLNQMPKFTRQVAMLDPDTVADALVEATETRPTLRTIPRFYYFLSLIARLSPALTRRIMGRMG